MTTHKREIGFSVDVFDVEDSEAVGCMASGAIGSEFAFVDVLVARDALSIDNGKVSESVTTGALGAVMAAFEDKAGAVGVVESHAGPFLEGVAHFALKFQVIVGHILSKRPARHKNDR